MAKIKKLVVEYYSFYCPGCKHLHVYSVNSDGSGWLFNGNLESPSFTPSLLNTMPVTNQETGRLEEKERCHLFVTEGKIRYEPDCFHEFAGQTVEMVDI